MYDNDYLEKILGEHYNMSNYFEDTYTEPNVNIIDSNDATNIKKENGEENNSDIKDKINNMESTNTVISDNKTKETLKDKINKTLNKDIYEISKLVENKNKDNDNNKDNGNANKNTIEQIKDYSIKEKTHQQIKGNQNNIENTDGIINEANSINDLYPEIYTVIEPIVELVVKHHINEEVDKELIDGLARKIYYAIEIDIDKEDNSNLSDAIPVSGRLVNAKRKPQNSLLYDLIKILILNNFINNKPQRPIPLKHHHNSNRPPMPPQPRDINVSNNTTYFDIPFPEDE